MGPPIHYAYSMHPMHPMVPAQMGTVMGMGMGMRRRMVGLDGLDVDVDGDGVGVRQCGVLSGAEVCATYYAQGSVSVDVTGSQSQSGRVSEQDRGEEVWWVWAWTESVSGGDRECDGSDSLSV